MYVAKKLVRNDGIRMTRTDVPDALRGTGLQRVKFKEWVGALWLVRHSKSQHSETLSWSFEKATPQGPIQVLSDFSPLLFISKPPISV